MRRLGVLVVLLVCAALPLPAVTSRSIVIERFEARAVVLTDGAVDITETLRLRFTGSWNGIIRDIPVDYTTPQGFNYSLYVELQSITDEQGAALRWERSRAGHFEEFKIWVPGASDAVRTVVLTYRLRNALRFFEEHDEFYWNVTGDEWEMPIESASGVVVLPPSATGLRGVAYTGAYRSRAQDATVDVLANSVHVTANRRLDTREGLTVAVAWDKGLVHEPNLFAKAALFLRMNWLLVVPLGAFGVMFSLWYTRGRDPRLRPIMAEYEPPAGLIPAEVGTLVDNSPDLRDITASIVDLAVRGYILIEEKDTEKAFGLWKGKDYTFRLRKPYKGVADLKPFEYKLLDYFFMGRQSSYVKDVLPTVTLSDLEHSFYKHLPDLRDLLFDELLRRGYYDRRPDKVKHVYMALGGALLALTFYFGGSISTALGVGWLTTVLSAGLSAGIIMAFGWFMPARTQKGAHVLESVLGFEEFLSRVEADRFQRMIKTPEMFEKYLPFAMALGVEKNWAEAFADIYKQPPEWYRGQPGQMFRANTFTSDLGMMSSSMSSAMTSAPRSTGSGGWGGGSGFGGGGFSGGGFGGGGGRGF